MLRIINSMGDRLLGLVAPRVTASAADCGSSYYQYRCTSAGYYQRRTCFSNSNCACNAWKTLYWGC